MNCRQCGHILNNNQTFCPNCGTKVEQGQIVNNNNMYQNNQFQVMNNQMYGQNNRHKKIRYHWEYGCFCIFMFWLPYFVKGFISLYASPSVTQSFKTFTTICTFIGLCTIPVFIIEAIIYSIRVKKSR